MLTSVFSLYPYFTEINTSSKPSLAGFPVRLKTRFKVITLNSLINLRPFGLLYVFLIYFTAEGLFNIITNILLVEIVTEFTNAKI